jgi:hypothetical protein
MKNPTNCHLWQLEKLTAEDLHGCFVSVEVFLDETHDRRCLFKCKTCGQLYFYEFHEEIDWTGGDDPQYRTYIPVETREEIETLLNSSGFALLKFSPRLQYDWPSDAPSPKVFWIGRSRESSC